jgi:MarR family transcriptional regulator for hemolysin
MNAPYRREQSAGYLTNHAARLFVRAIERRLEGGMAGPMPVFFALMESESLTQAALAKWAAVEQPTMANTLARMSRDGLVESTPDPEDKRASLIRLTGLGRKRATAALAAAQDVNALALGGLKPREREVYFELLQRVIAALGADA